MNQLTTNNEQGISQIHVGKVQPKGIHVQKGGQKTRIFGKNRRGA